MIRMVIAIGRMPGKQGQAQERQELRQTDQAQIEHPAGQVIDLPAHRDDFYLLQRDGAQEPAPPHSRRSRAAAEARKRVAPSKPSALKLRMIVGPAAERPVVFALGLGDRQVVDARDPQAHQAVLVELPVLVAVAAEPLAAVVVPFIGEAHGDAVAREGPQLP